MGWQPPEPRAEPRPSAAQQVRRPEAQVERTDHGDGRVSIKVRPRPVRAAAEMRL